MSFMRGGLEKKDFLALYEALWLPRLIEERMLLLLRQGRISKWFAGIGQEAISVGSTWALGQEDYVLPLHRNLGVFTTRKLPLERLFNQLRGVENGYTQGRDRSFHFGTKAHHIVGMISHLGAQLGVADGLALASKLKGEGRVVLAFCGEGATSEGDFHEAVNLAAVWKLPVIFLIENNAYGLSTPTEEQYACKQLIDKGIGYGIDSRQIDGNNVLAVHHNIRYYAAELRKNPRAVLIEAMTFRMRGHEEASGTAYVPKELMMHWAERDPVLQYRLWLNQEGMLGEAEDKVIESGLKKRIEKALKSSFASADVVAEGSKELKDVYAPALSEVVVAPKAGAVCRSRRFVDAISDALRQGMERDEHVVLLGQDIAKYGGVFKVTQGFVDAFGADRVRNTPLCESAVLGAALGMAIAGRRAVVEMQFADFVSCGFNQIVNNLAKVYYRWGQAAGAVIRLPTGAGVGAGPFHSQSCEAWFFHTPGLKILYPATVHDAKGLLLAALREPNPCLFFEHKALYRSLAEDIPDALYETPIGKARVVHPGSVASIITYGMGVHWALEAIKEMNLDVEIIDLRTLLPWDKDAVAASVRKTGRVLVLHEACQTGGVGAELAAWVATHCFESLDAPVARLGSLDTPVPFSKALEDAFLAKSRFKETLEDLLAY